MSPAGIDSSDWLVLRWVTWYLRLRRIFNFCFDIVVLFTRNCLAVATWQLVDAWAFGSMIGALGDAKCLIFVGWRDKNMMLRLAKRIGSTTVGVVRLFALLAWLAQILIIILNEDCLFSLKFLGVLTLIRR
jgi:hypothetical protein